MKLTKVDFIALRVGILYIILVAITLYIKKFQPDLFMSYKLFVLENILHYISYMFAIYIIVLRIRWAIYDSRQNNKTNVIEIYEEIVKKYPESEQAKKAKERLSELEKQK